MLFPSSAAGLLADGLPFFPFSVKTNGYEKTDTNHSNGCCTGFSPVSLSINRRCSDYFCLV
jgi:hypothetical protein